MITLNWKTDRFAEFQSKCPNIALVLVEKHTDAAVDLMKQLAPVDTGHMRDSIHKVEGPKHGGMIASRGVKIDAPYWVFVEYGTVHMSAQPFVTPAMESIRSGFVLESARLIRAELGQARDSRGRFR